MSSLSRRANIHTSNPHTGMIQRGKDFDIVFLPEYNEQGDAYVEEDFYPKWIEDFDGFLFMIMDFWDNWHDDGIAFEDSFLTLITKDGKYISSNDYFDFKDFYNAIKPFTKNHFAAAIYSEVGEDYFWVNGWDGYQSLQQYTGWFDMDIYYQWI